MQTINFSIEIPQNRVLDIKAVKQKVMDFAMHLIYTDFDSQAKVQENNKRKINVSEEVAWFKNNPVVLTNEDIDEKAKYILDK